MMTNYAYEKKIGQNSIQWTTGFSDSREVTVLIYLLEIITKIGRYYPILFLSLASLNVLLAANDFLANNIEFGILNSLFAASNFIFLVQLLQNNKIHPFDSRSNEIDSRSFLGVRERVETT
ncbi:MAG: hypothetical protein OEM77_01660 [Nitrosopumilus sp.]|nr:hypothetical protein [Nitrosopumilus sp.]MDH3736189.1 hypothetical protein [Nitrosopumilus sp.]MDH3822523.1 hypothetical protein [Nitrosopumilus sp.]MDH3833473.1 hypothetical protein [Nitrosopumilus sp.]